MVNPVLTASHVSDVNASFVAIHFYSSKMARGICSLRFSPVQASVRLVWPPARTDSRTLGCLNLKNCWPYFMVYLC